MNVRAFRIDFAKEVYRNIFNPRDKVIKWGEKNNYPNLIINLYESVPEHSAAIDFIEGIITGNGIEEIDYWLYKKIVIDYLLFGGFTILKTALRNGTNTYEYIDISKCRLSPDNKSMLYSEEWNRTKVETITYPIINDKNKGSGIFYFKSHRSRGIYPTPYYLSALQSLDTLNSIIEFHNTSAKNGFSPNVIINFNNGVPDEETQSDIESSIKEKFTGSEGQRFILAFNDNKDSAVTIEKLQADNLDEKFTDLQKFLQNEIIISHRITSPQLIGVKTDNTGFSKVEYQESLDIFKETVISNFEKELDYAMSLLIGAQPNKIV